MAAKTIDAARNETYAAQAVDRALQGSGFADRVVTFGASRDSPHAKIVTPYFATASSTYGTTSKLRS